MKKLVTAPPAAQQQKFLQDYAATLDQMPFSWILSNTFLFFGGFGGIWAFIFFFLFEKVVCTFGETHPKHTH